MKLEIGESTHDTALSASTGELPSLKISAPPLVRVVPQGVIDLFVGTPTDVCTRIRTVVTTRGVPHTGGGGFRIPSEDGDFDVWQESGRRGVISFLPADTKKVAALAGLVLHSHLPPAVRSGEIPLTRDDVRRTFRGREDAIISTISATLPSAERWAADPETRGRSFTVEQKGKRVEFFLRTVPRSSIRWAFSFADRAAVGEMFDLALRVVNPPKRKRTEFPLNGRGIERLFIADSRRVLPGIRAALPNPRDPDSPLTATLTLEKGVFTAHLRRCGPHYCWCLPCSETERFGNALNLIRRPPNLSRRKAGEVSISHKGLKQYVHGYASDTVKAILARLPSNGTPYTQKPYLLCIDGHKKPFELSYRMRGTWTVKRKEVARLLAAVGFNPRDQDRIIQSLKKTDVLLARDQWSKYVRGDVRDAVARLRKILPHPDLSPHTTYKVTIGKVSGEFVKRRKSVRFCWTCSPETVRQFAPELNLLRAPEQFEQKRRSPELRRSKNPLVMIAGPDLEPYFRGNWSARTAIRNLLPQCRLGDDHREYVLKYKGQAFRFERVQRSGHLLWGCRESDLVRLGSLLELKPRTKGELERARALPLPSAHEVKLVQSHVFPLLRGNTKTSLSKLLAGVPDALTCRDLTYRHVVGSEVFTLHRRRSSRHSTVPVWVISEKELQALALAVGVRLKKRGEPEVRARVAVAKEGEEFITPENLGVLFARSGRVKRVLEKLLPADPLPYIGKKVTRSTVAGKVSATPRRRGSFVGWTVTDDSLSVLSTLANAPRRTQSLGKRPSRPKQGEIGLCVSDLGLYFTSRQVKTLQELLPDPLHPDTPRAFVLKRGGTEIEFHVRRSGTQWVWHFPKKNINRLSAMTETPLRTVDFSRFKSLRSRAANETAISQLGIAATFRGDNKKIIDRLLAMLPPRADLDGPDVVTLKLGNAEVPFYRRRQGGHIIWCFRTADAPLIAKAEGFVLKSPGERTRRKGLLSVQPGDLPVSSPAFGRYFLQPSTVFALVRGALPSPRTCDKAEIVLNGRRFTAEVRRSGLAGLLWVLKLRNLGALAAATEVPLSGVDRTRRFDELPYVKYPEVRISIPAVREEGYGSSKAVQTAVKDLKKQLPSPLGISDSSYTLRLGEHDVVFYPRKVSQSLATWAVLPNALAHIAAHYGLETVDEARANGWDGPVSNLLELVE